MPHALTCLLTIARKHIVDKLCVQFFGHVAGLCSRGHCSGGYCFRFHAHIVKLKLFRSLNGPTLFEEVHHGALAALRAPAYVHEILV